MSKLESQFKVFSQDYKTKKTLDQLCEKVNSMEAKLEELSAKKKL